VILNTATKVSQGPDQKEVREPAPRPEAEIEKLRKVVMGAVGFSEKRGDEVTLVEMPFDTSVADRERALLDQPAPAPPPPPAALNIKLLAAVGAGVLVLLGAIVWLLLRGRRRRVAGMTEVTRALNLDATIGDEPVAVGVERTAEVGPRRPPRPPAPLVSDEALALTREREDIRQKALTMANTEPDATAQLLRAWLVKKKAPQPVRGGSHAG
jgi:flagellar M-ring protein FliF